MSNKEYQHLGLLIFKYFLRNRRRTFRAVLILAIGISMVLSTHMLMSGFLLQIQQFATLIDSSSNVVFLSGSNLDQGVYTNLAIDLDEQEINQHLALRHEITEIQYQGDMQSVLLTQTNIQTLDDWGWISLNSPPDDSSYYLSQKSNFINDSILFEGLPSQGYDLSTFQILDKITSDLLVDETHILDIEMRINQVAIRVFNQGQLDVVNDLATEHALEIVDTEPSNLFLEITADQITWILILLQFALSFLLVLAIFYVMITLVMESAPDLRVLHMIGYGKRKIFTLFLAQSLLVSIIAVVIAFLFSMIFLQTILPWLTFFNLPYSLISIDLGFLAITSIQSLLVGLLAGIYPAKVGADYYG